MADNGEVEILVVGTGAVGGFYGGKLVQAGAHVSTVCRSDFEVVKAKGIEVKSIWGDFNFTPEKVIHKVDDYDAIPDYILVTLKVLPEIDTAKMIRSAVGPDTAIVLLQNGIDIEKPIANAYPNHEIISGLAFVCLNRIGPGKIHHLDYGRLVLGSYPEGLSEKARRLADLFHSAGVSCKTTEDVVTARWQKLLWNAPFNPISVLGGGVDTKTVLDLKESSSLARKIMEEICFIAKASGHELPSAILQNNLDETAKMKPYKTSMLLDYEAKRAMEVEAILGNAVRVAENKGVSAPHLESLYALIKLIDQKRIV